MEKMCVNTGKTALSFRLALCDGFVRAACEWNKGGAKKAFF